MQGFEWNKYNQTHYDVDNPPPKIVQGYKFNVRRQYSFVLSALCLCTGDNNVNHSISSCTITDRCQLTACGSKRVCCVAVHLISSRSCSYTVHSLCQRCVIVIVNTFCQIAGSSRVCVSCARSVDSLSLSIVFTCIIKSRH